MVPMKPALEVRNVTKKFDSLLAVDDISFDVQGGTTTSIIGPNGAGKTTLFGAMAGEHVATAGSVRLNGKDITSWSASRLARAGVSRTFQVARFFPTQNVVENLMMARIAARGQPLSPWQAFGSDAGHRARVEEVLVRLRLESLAGRLGSMLAQGDRKRLELAMALVQDPSVLLLDEPTAGMSLEDVAETLELLLEVRQQQPDLTIVLTAHDMEVVFALSDKVILMGRGRLMLEGTPGEVEAHETTRELYLGTKA